MLQSNELVHRRRLRLQQVREQSKDIAKKIRQRTKVEKYRHLLELDSQKEKEYLERQEIMVAALEAEHASGLQMVGTGHGCAKSLQKVSEKPIDLSKARGRSAALELRQRRQKELDEKKKHLERKLHAREIANEISRDKCTAIKDTCKQDKPQSEDNNKENVPTNECCKAAQLAGVDMFTQCSGDGLTRLCDTNVPDVPDVPEVPLVNEHEGAKRKLDLFAVSEDMPTSLGTTYQNYNKEEDLFKPSNRIAEHVLNRGMRLRQTESLPEKSSSNELKSIKQTILKSKTSRTSEAKTQALSSNIKSKSCLTKTSDVTLYKHNTGEASNINFNNDLVVRELPLEDDAYSRAVREATKLLSAERECVRARADESRHKVAADKLRVEREYQDTMAFLNSQTKQRVPRPDIRKSHYPEHKQEEEKVAQQKVMQQEYKKIEKECRKHCSKSKSKWPPKSFRFPDCGDTVSAPTEVPPVQYSWSPTYRPRHNHTPPTKERSGNLVIYKIVSNTDLVQNVATSLAAVDSLITTIPHQKTQTEDIREGICAVSKETRNDLNTNSADNNVGSQTPTRDSQTDTSKSGSGEFQREIENNDAAKPKPTINIKANQVTESGIKPNISDSIPKPDRNVNPRDDFYIGASGYMKDDDYEVIIHLKKKDANEAPKNTIEEKPSKNVSNESVKEKSNTEVIDTEQQNEATNTKVQELNIIDTNTKIKLGVSACTQTSMIKSDTEVIDTEVQNEPANTKVQETNTFDTEIKLRVSACTQTSLLETPKQRPVYYHMSSSTSTSYLSPPEITRPNKYYNEMMCKETQVSVTDKSTNEDVTSTTDNITSDKIKTKHRCKKHSKKHNKSNIKNTLTHGDNLKILFEMLDKKSQLCKSDENLNSVLKKYVNEVLKLNKDSIRAVEVANQHCSSVSTPGSSVLNVSTNTDRNSHSTTLYNQHIKNILLRHISYLNNPDNIPQNKYKNQQNVQCNKKKYSNKHKIKSIYVSKNVTKRTKLKNNTKTIKSSSVRSKTDSGGESLPCSMPTVKNLQNLYVKHSSINSNDKETVSKTDKDGINKESSIQKEITCKPPSEFNKKDNTCKPKKHHKINDKITETSTQTNRHLEQDMKFLQLEADKIKNMEKIADLTEKCTKKLNHLAKVLEKIRKNKSKSYIINDIETESGHNSNFNNIPNNHEELRTENETDPVMTFKSIESDDSKKNDLIPIAEKTSSLPTPIKCRPKPPTVISRGFFEDVLPHELSTVPEIDTPSSYKRDTDINSKNISTNNDIHTKSPIKEISSYKLQKNSSANTQRKLEFLDLSKRNELFLKPFQSLEEFAKKCQIETLDDGSNLEAIKDDITNDEISSLHSDGSLPDVISELLKRNIIKEPFKFNYPSNSNTLSSDSSSSFTNIGVKELLTSKINNIKSDTSDSAYSKLDLENTLKKMGLGWASSTLKKTQERQAMSTSSSGSTSSLSLKYELKRNDLVLQKLPALVRDSSREVTKELSKTVEQQTSTEACMTVNEFLRKELATKMTFCNKSEGQEHFTSLYSTHLPDTSAADRTARAGSRPPSRQRTSTPVQLYKSTHYDTNSSTNNSNGIFGHLDELSSVKVTSSSLKNTSNSEYELTIPNYSLNLKKNSST